MEWGHDEERIYVPTCGIKASRRPAILHTVLGSCVAVCLFDAKRHIGGMTHFLLAESPPDVIVSPAAIGKYANLAIPGLVRALELLGADAEDLVAKIAGGARVLKHSPYGDLPGRNIEAAQKALRAYKIPVVSDATGGIRGRKIEFHSQCGRLVVDTARIM